MDKYKKKSIIRELRRLAVEALNYDSANSMVNLYVCFSDYNLESILSDTEELCQEIINSDSYDEALDVIEQINCFDISSCGFCKLEEQELLNKYGIDAVDSWGGGIQYDLMKLRRKYTTLFESFKTYSTWEEFQEEVGEKVKRVEILKKLDSIYNSLFSLQCWYMEEKKMFPLDVIDGGFAGYNYQVKRFTVIDDNGEIVKIWNKSPQEAREISGNTPNLQEKAEKTGTNVKSYNNNTRRKGGRPNRRNSSLKECIVGVEADELLALLHNLIDGKQAVIGVQYITACILGGLLEKPTGGIIEKEFPHITASNYNKRKKEMTEQEKELKLKVVQELLKQK